MSKSLRSRKPSKWILLIAFAVLAAGSSSLAQQPQDGGEDLEVLQVHPNFYMIAGAGGNIAVQIGPIGAILVNAGREEMADKVLAAVTRLTNLPIRYIIDTSGDAGIVGGNAKLAKAGATILAGAVGQSGVPRTLSTTGA